MKCIECGHDTINKKQNICLQNLEKFAFIIYKKNVPAMVCEHCNELLFR